MKVFPFYLPSINNLKLIRNVADEMKPISWAVPYCNSSSDLAYCLLLLRSADKESCKKMLENYNAETVGSYIILKEIDSKLSSFFKKVEPTA